MESSYGSRYEMNRRLKSILVRHAANLTLLKWSSSRTTAYFYGVLKKEPDREFDLAGLNALLEDLAHLPNRPRFKFNLDNWDISSASGSWVVTRKERRVLSGGGFEGSRIETIHKIEKPKDILDEIKSDQERDRDNEADD